MKEKQTAENQAPEKLPETIPYIAHEAEVARLERILHRLLVMCIVLVLLLVATNAGWLYYEAQFDTVETDSYTYEVASNDSGHAIINGEGSVSVNGSSEDNAHEDANPTP